MRIRLWRAFSVLALLGSLSAHSGPSLPLEEAEREALAGEPVAWKLCSSTATPVEYSPGAVAHEPGELVRAEAGLLFSADNGRGGRDLWKSTGPERAGTSLVKDFAPLLEDMSPLEITLVGARVFFTAEDPEHGRELWVTDGTPEGTREVKDLWPGPTGSFPQSLFEFNGLLYFSAGDEEHGQELWRSDGTPEGTFMVEDLEPGPEGSSPQGLTRGSGSAFYFVIEREGSFRALMRSTGAAGAVELFRVDEMNTLESLTLVGQRLFFVTGSMHDHMTELWMTEGAQPVLLKMFSEVQEMATLGGRLYLSASTMDDPAGMELWRSDGTSTGTVRLKDLRPGSEASSPQGFTVLGRRLFFSADDGVHGRELWVSDGSAAGTQLLVDLSEGEVSSSPQELTAIQGHLFFIADKAGGQTPWVSDGTLAGTLPIGGPTADVQLSDVQSPKPSEFMRSGWNVFFTAEDGPRGRRLWALPFRPAGRCPGDSGGGTPPTMTVPTAL
jgi:ELWxxDGT repeat protein